MCNDQTLIADSLLASNPTEAAKQDIASKGLHKIYHRKTENANSDDGNDVLESDTTPDGAGTTRSIVSGEQLPDRFDGNISQNPENANQEEECLYDTLLSSGAKRQVLFKKMNLPYPAIII